MESKDEVPVLVICFRRPELAEQQVENLKRLTRAPIYLYLDGPRNEQEKRYADSICNTFTNAGFPAGLRIRRETRNQGCRRSVISAIDWVFEENSSAIILEDDLLVSASAYEYFTHCLRVFESDLNVFMVSALNELGEWAGQGSYFRTTGGTWGWATWASKWKHMHSIEQVLNDASSQLRIEELRRLVPRRVWRVEAGFHLAKHGFVDTWDYDWALVRMAMGGRSITPRVNQVKNVGLGPTATHTKRTRNLTPNLRELRLPIVDNPDASLDLAYLKRVDRGGLISDLWLRLQLARHARNF